MAANPKCFRTNNVVDFDAFKERKRLTEIVERILTIKEEEEQLADEFIHLNHDSY